MSSLFIAASLVSFSEQPKTSIVMPESKDVINENGRKRRKVMLKDDDSNDDGDEDMDVVSWLLIMKLLVQIKLENQRFLFVRYPTKFPCSPY